MNYFPLLKLAHLVLYFFIAAQGAFYLLGFYKVLSGIPSHDFILLRKAADPVLAPHLKILYILTLLVSLLILATHFRAFTVSTLVLLSAAVLLLGIDIFVRRGKRVVGLTQEGQEAIGYIERILSETDDLKRFAARQRDIATTE